MTNHASILIHTRDLEQLIELLSSDELPSCYWPLADTLIDRFDAALEEKRPRPRPRLPLFDSGDPSLGDQLAQTTA